MLTSVVPQMTQLTYVIDGVFTGLTLAGLIAVTAAQLGWLTVVLIAAFAPLFGLAIWCVRAVGRLWGLVSRENQKRADEAAELVVDLDLITRQDLSDPVLRAVDRQREGHRQVLVRRARLQALSRSLDRYMTVTILMVCAALLQVVGSDGTSSGSVAAALLATSLVVERSMNAIADYRVLRLVREVVPQLEGLRDAAASERRQRNGAPDTSGVEFVSADRLRQLMEVGIERSQLVSRDQPLFAGTVRSNLMQPPGSEARVAELVAIVELDVPLDRDLPAGRSGVSEGQRARIVLIRALLQHPALLLVDEALDTLPSSLARRIISRLSSEGLCMVIATARTDLSEAEPTVDLTADAAPMPNELSEVEAADSTEGFSILTTLRQAGTLLWSARRVCVVGVLVAVSAIGLVIALSRLDAVASDSSLPALGALAGVVAMGWLATAAAVGIALGAAAERTTRFYRSILKSILRRPPINRSKLVANLTYDFEHLEISVPGSMVGLAFAIADAATLLALTLVVQPAAVFVVAPLVLVSWWCTRMASRWQAAAESSESDSRSILLDSTAVTTSHAAHRYPNLSAEPILTAVHEQAGRFADRLYWSCQLSWRSTYLVRVTNATMIAAVVVVAAATGGTAATGLSLVLIVSMQQIGALNESLQDSGGSASVLRRVFALARLQGEDDASRTRGTVALDHRGLTFNGVTAQAAPDAPSVSIDKFIASPGEMIAIIGPSGGGKSTILYASAAALRDAGNKWCLAGSELPAIGKGGDYAATIAPSLSHLATTDTVIAGADGPAIQAVNLSRASSPNAYDVVLLDEATARISVEDERRFFQALRSDGVTLVALHRTDNLDLFDRVLLCEGGIIREDTTLRFRSAT